MRYQWKPTKNIGVIANTLTALHKRKEKKNEENVISKNNIELWLVLLFFYFRQHNGTPLIFQNKAQNKPETNEYNFIESEYRANSFVQIAKMQTNKLSFDSVFGFCFFFLFLCFLFRVVGIVLEALDETDIQLIYVCDTLWQLMRSLTYI